MFSAFYKMYRSFGPREVAAVGDHGLSGDDTTRFLHVFPLYGREHLTEGTDCWCSPSHEDHRPQGSLLIIHREEN